jgi:hypothetical protein
MGLLLLKTAVSLERRYPQHKKRPGWAGGLTTALFLAFIIADGLAVTHVARLGVLLLGLVTAVYIFTPRHDFSAVHSTRAAALPRILELTLAAMLAMLIPAWVTVPTALGLVMLPVNAINVISPSAGSAGYDGTMVDMVQGLYRIHPSALLLLTAVPALLMLLVTVSAKIADSRRKGGKQ